MRIRQFLGVAALLAALPAFAQTEPDQPPKKVIEVYPLVETHDFDTVEIISEKKKVPGFRFLSRVDDKYPPMIDERVHFKRDLAKSAGFGIKRSVKATETEAK